MSPLLTRKAQRAGRAAACLSRLVPPAICLLAAVSAGASGNFQPPEWRGCSHPAGNSAPAADPQTYPDDQGFQKRRKILIPALAGNDLSKWRRGYFSGGDPGKYLPGAAMAKLLINPDDAEAIRYMNDDRSPKEHYHFAAINWARFLPVFGGALTPETKAILASEAAKYSAYLNLGGTENHRMMNLCAAVILPDYLEGGRIANKGREEALREAKEKLRSYVKGLYAAGQGEWDSSTYLMFDLHGFLNIYDFSKDPEARLIAAAALDWFTAAYALKFRDGIYSGPNQRGYYNSPMESIADQTGWLWWGSRAKPESAASFNFAIHPATSSWRPNAVLTRIARKELPGLPVTMENRKPNYWFGQGIPPVVGEYVETLHLSPSFTMGSLRSGFGGQITRFQLVADGPSGPLALTGGHPRKSDHTGKLLGEVTYRDGGGRYDQSFQDGPLYVCLSRIPDDEPLDYTFVSIPRGTRPVQIGGRWIFRMGDAWVCVVPFGKGSEIAAPDLNEKEVNERTKAAAAGKPLPDPAPVLKISGRPSGFAIIAAEADKFPNEEAFAAWAAKEYVFDTGRFSADVSVALETGDGRRIKVSHAGSAAQAPSPGPIYSGPFVKLDHSVLEISDGKSGYAVDFTGPLPVYRTIN